MTPFHRLGLLAAAMALVVALGVVGVYVSWIVALVAFAAGTLTAVACTIERAADELATEEEPPADLEEQAAARNGEGLQVRSRREIERSARRGREVEELESE